MSSTTIRHSGVHENSQSAARLANEHIPPTVDYWAAASHYPPGFGPGEPHYEPAHLRHRPGDDWKIGGKPHDPDDPGPYGTPGWHQDRRTGRHRRGELPDPLPETESEVPEGFTRMQAPEGSAYVGEPEGFSHMHEVEGFSRLQEEAYQAFLRDSEELHRAHYETAEEHRALVRLRWLLRVVLAILYWRVLPFPKRPAPRSTQNRELKHTNGPRYAGVSKNAGKSRGAGRDVYRPKRAARKLTERTAKRPATRPGDRTTRNSDRATRSGDRATRRDGRTRTDHRPAPGRRPAPGPHAVQRRRLNTNTSSAPGTVNAKAGKASVAGTSAGVASGPQAFFAAVRAARAEISMTGMTGMTGMAGVVGGEAL